MVMDGYQGREGGCLRLAARLVRARCKSGTSAPAQRGDGPSEAALLDAVEEELHLAADSAPVDG